MKAKTVIISITILIILGTIILVVLFISEEEKKNRLPDLSIKNLKCHGRFNIPRDGDDKSCSMDIVNIGRVPVDGTFRSAAYYENKLLTQNDYISYHISSGNSIETSISSGVFEKSGQIKICVVVDFKNEINEYNENNNIECTTTEVLPKKETGLPDLQIKNLRYYKESDSVYVGDIVGYKFDIFNGGDADFKGDLEIGYTYTNNKLEDQKTINDMNIPMGETKSIEIISERLFPEIGDTELSVIIDYWNKIREVYDVNNREAHVVNVLQRN